jgi:hypothetical protein
MVLDTATLKYRMSVCDIYVSNNISYEIFAEKCGFKKFNINIPEEITKHGKSDTFRYIISIFGENEFKKDKTAIPIYNYLLNTDLSEISVRLPEKKYYYQIKNVFGEVLHFGNF